MIHVPKMLHIKQFRKIVPYRN